MVFGHHPGYKSGHTVVFSKPKLLWKQVKAFKKIIPIVLDNVLIDY